MVCLEAPEDLGLALISLKKFKLNCKRQTLRSAVTICFINQASPKGLTSRCCFFAAKGNYGDKAVKEKLTETFKVDLPQDFFDFWEFCKKLNDRNPCGK